MFKRLFERFLWEMQWMFGRFPSWILPTCILIGLIGLSLLLGLVGNIGLAQHARLLNSQARGQNKPISTSTPMPPLGSLQPILASTPKTAPTPTPKPGPTLAPTPSPTPTPTPSPSPTPMPSPTPTPSPSPTPTPSPSPTPMPSPTPTPSPAPLAIDNILCGTDAQFPDPANNIWTFVQAGEPVTTPDGRNLLAVGYQGGPGNCTGEYHYGWDNYYHLAQWTLNYPLSSSFQGSAQCSVSVYSANWFFGAPDAQYTLALSGASSQTVTFVPFDQNHDGPGGWFELSDNATGQTSFTLNIDTSAGANSLTFLLTLRNGGGQGKWWYLGADAVHFVCRS